MISAELALVEAFPEICQIAEIVAGQWLHRAGRDEN